jgi:hypothetical protein
MQNATNNQDIAQTAPQNGDLVVFYNGGVEYYAKVTSQRKVNHKLDFAVNLMGGDEDQALSAPMDGCPHGTDVWTIESK